MIAYSMFGTNDLEKSAAFYDELFGAIGVNRIMDTDRSIGWGVSMDKPMFIVTKPENGDPATYGNGTMIALTMPDTASVDKIYNKAIELGAQCEGKAGPRGEQFYCGYFRDPDGNKLNAFAFQG